MEVLGCRAWGLGGGPGVEVLASWGGGPGGWRGGGG